MSEIIVVGGGYQPREQSSSSSEPDADAITQEIAELQAQEQQVQQRQRIMTGIIVAVGGAIAVYLLWPRRKEKESKVQGAPVLGAPQAQSWPTAGGGYVHPAYADAAAQAAAMGYQQPQQPQQYAYPAVYAYPAAYPGRW
jgi:hypothetical protein